MFTCKQVSNALAEKDYESLTPRQKMGLKIHVALCGMCGKYNRQIMDMQDTVRRFLGREDEGEDLPDVQLEPDAAEAMKASLRDAAKTE